MKFERIEILNFACYYGEHTIVLETTAEKPVVIVIGANGSGKTSIFDAINWSLYGGEYEQDLIKRRQRKIEDFVNLKALREACDLNTSVEMSSTVYFEHEEINYYITQSICVKPTKNQNGDLSIQTTDRMTALYRIRPDGNHAPLAYNQIFLDEILPSNVKDYFLFDGDRIYQLSNPGSSQQVRDAINRVVDLELIQNAITHLGKIATEFRTMAKRYATGELSEVDALYNEEMNKMNKLKGDLNDLKSDERALRDQIDVLEERLASLPDTSALQAKRESLENQLKVIDDQKDLTLSQIRIYCSQSALAMANESIVALTSELDNQRQKGQIPRTVSKALINDLLKMKKCICGKSFNEGDETYQALQKKLEEEVKRTSGQELLEVLFQIKSMSDNLDLSLINLKNAYEKHNKLTEIFQEYNIALKQVDNELEKLPKEDISKIANDLRNRREDLITITKKITITNLKIVDSEKSINEYDHKREVLGKKQVDYIKCQRREQIAQEATSVLENIFEAFSEDSRKSVETLTKNEFYEFIESVAGYKVELDENYELLVLDENGNRALQRLSMGQSQCLSLSFITAISRVSEKNPPLVIDMPFGRLDPEVHNSISKRLPEITSQLILFLLPTIEWNEITKKNLLPKAKHVYTLNFDKTTQTTEISDGSGR